MKEVIQIKGSLHPDQIVEQLVTVAHNTLVENFPAIYANFDKSILIGGKFPKLIISGSMAFDFRKYSKEERYEIQNKIRDEVVKYFKNKFNDAYLNVEFQLNLEPSILAETFPEHKIWLNNYVVHNFNTATKMEIFSTEITNLIEISEYPNDYKLVVCDEKVLINQTFYENNNQHLNTYIDWIGDIVNRLSSEYFEDKSWDVIVNNDFQYTDTVLWSKFGSSLFYNTTAISGKSNGLYGFRSSIRPESVCVAGKHHASDLMKVYDKCGEFDGGYTTGNYQTTAVCAMGDDVDNFMSYTTSLT